MSEHKPVEEKVASHDAELHAIRSDISGLKNLFSDLADEVRQGFRRINENNKTDIGKVIGAATGVFAIILVIIGFVGNGYVRDINRVESDGRALLEARIKSLEVVSNLQTRTKAAEESIEKLDVVLQREMRLLDDATSTELKALAQRIHKENELLEKADNVRFNEIERRLGVIEGWQDNHDKRVVGLNAAQWERIKGLERKVYGKADKVSFGAAMGAE